MSRLTSEDITKVCMDPWEICGIQNTCNRNCLYPTSCPIPDMIRKLAKYEDTGIEPEDVTISNEYIRPYINR